MVRSNSSGCSSKVLTQASPEEEALDFIKHQDRQRRIYHDQHCKGDWGDAKCYDLVINSARLDIPGTVDILEQYIRSRAAQLDDRSAGE